MSTLVEHLIDSYVSEETKQINALLDQLFSLYMGNPRITDQERNMFDNIYSSLSRVCINRARREIGGAYNKAA